MLSLVHYTLWVSSSAESIYVLEETSSEPASGLESGATAGPQDEQNQQNESFGPAVRFFSSACQPRNFPPKQTFSLGFPLEICDWLNDVSIPSLFHFAANHRKRGFAKNKNHVPIFSLFLFLRTCQKV